jgi:hypothetical protein
MPPQIYFIAFVLFIVFVRVFFPSHKYRNDYDEEISCNLPPITVPPRGTNPALGIKLSVRTPNYWGAGLKQYYKGKLKENRLYHQLIEIDPPVDSIHIETIGDWIFGLPEYEGNVRFLPDQGGISIQVPLDAPKEVISLLQSVFPGETKVSGNINESKFLNQPSILLPSRSSNPAFGKLVEIPIPNPHGSGVKQYIKAMVKEHPLFNCPITIEPPINGWTNKGEPIPINTLGLWVFGTTGYDGNVRFLPDEGRIRIQVPLESPDEVEVLLRSFFKPERISKPSVPEVTEVSFSAGSAVTGGENALKTQVKTWVRNRQVNKLR